VDLKLRNSKDEILNNSRAFQDVMNLTVFGQPATVFGQPATVFGQPETNYIFNRTLVKKGSFFRMDDKDNLVLVKTARHEFYNDAPLPYEQQTPLWFTKNQVDQALRQLEASCVQLPSNYVRAPVANYERSLYAAVNANPGKRLYLDFRRSATSGHQTPYRAVYHPILRIPFDPPVSFGAKDIVGCFISFPTEEGMLNRFHIGLIFAESTEDSGSVPVPDPKSTMDFGFGFKLSPAPSDTVGLFIALIFGRQGGRPTVHDLTGFEHKHTGNVDRDMRDGM